MRPLVHRQRFGPEDRDEAYYRYVAIEVPEGAPGLTARLTYDRSAAVVDLGLLGAGGFRGWSGGQREWFSISPTAATPGYLPGPLEAGEWRVMLGLYRLPPEGVDVVVEARVEPTPLPPSAPPPPVPTARSLRRPPASAGRRWVAGDLHAHTEHSDGRHTVEELAALARSQGLEFLAVTDHNTVSHHRRLAQVSRRYGITLIPGQEMTTPEGHANCFGDVGWVDFRASADEWLASARRAGGLLSINHPVDGDCSWGRPMRGVPDLVEVWHGSWNRRTPETLEWWKRLGTGFGVGGSDYHRPGEGMPGLPTTWIEVDQEDGGAPSIAAVLEGLRTGRVAVARAPDAPTLTHLGNDVMILGGHGATLVHEAGETRPVGADLVRVSGKPGLWRLLAPDGSTLALTSHRG